MNKTSRTLKITKPGVTALVLGVCTMFATAPSFATKRSYDINTAREYIYPGCAEEPVEIEPDVFAKVETCHTNTIQLWSREQANDYDWAKLFLAEDFCTITWTNGMKMQLVGKNHMHKFGKFHLYGFDRTDKIFDVRPFVVTLPSECDYKLQARGSYDNVFGYAKLTDTDDTWTAKPILGSTSTCQRFNFGDDKNHDTKHPDPGDCVQ